MYSIGNLVKQSRWGLQNVEIQLNLHCRHLRHFMQFIKFNIEMQILHVHAKNARLYIVWGKLLWWSSFLDELAALN